MDGVQARVQENVNKMLNTVDKEHLRKIQAEMFRCNAKCCETSHYDMQDVQRCMDRCSEPAAKAQSYVQSELQGLQERLQRCAMDCQDEVKDKVVPSTTEADVAKLRKNMETCVCKCADKHIDLIPNLMKKMKQVLSQGGYTSAQTQ